MEASIAQSPYLDEQTLTKLLSFIDKEGLQNICYEGITEIDVCFAKLQLSHKVKEKVNCYHKMKGICRTLGLAKLGQLCYFCETHLDLWTEPDYKKADSRFFEVYSLSKQALTDFFTLDNVESY